MLGAGEERPGRLVDPLRDPGGRDALLDALLEDRVDRVLDLRPRRDRRHPADRRDAVQNACAFRGLTLGSRNAGERETEISEGTVRPVRATTRCPSGPSANSMNLHAESFRLDAAARQYASECRMPACSRSAGSGATSQSKSSIVRKAGVERREERSIARRPFAKRASSSSASRS
jgi:hypothetical protein